MRRIVFMDTHFINDNRATNDRSFAIRACSFDQKNGAPMTKLAADQFKSELLLLLPRLKRYAMILTQSDADADDLLQDSCTKMLAGWQSYDNSRPLDRWCFTILRNCWMSEQRRRKTRHYSGQMPIEEAYELSDGQDGDEALFARQVNGMVANLPTELSSTLLLVCLEGYSYQEAADMMDVPIGTIMSRIYRARRILSDHLKDDQTRHGLKGVDRND